MKSKNNIPDIERALKKEKLVALLAPSFVTDFHYPSIITELKSLGFKKVVELTFGAKMINRDYHKQLLKSEKLLISSVCPGIVQSIKARFPHYEKNLILVDSPMIAMAKICKKTYPGYKTCFISPCHMKKVEAQESDYLDYVIDYQQLHALLHKKLIAPSNHQETFDKFYNDYTKVYPLSGGLSKTAHLKQVLRPREEKIIDGWPKIEKFLKNPDKKVRFLDVTFCEGGCIGGPCTSKISLRKKKKLLTNYMCKAKCEPITEENLGTISKAKGITFSQH